MYWVSVHHAWTPSRTTTGIYLVLEISELSRESCCYSGILAADKMHKLLATIKVRVNEMVTRAIEQWNDSGDVNSWLMVRVPEYWDKVGNPVQMHHTG